MKLDTVVRETKEETGLSRRRQKAGRLSSKFLVGVGVSICEETLCLYLDQFDGRPFSRQLYYRCGKGGVGRLGCDGSWCEFYTDICGFRY